MIKDLIKKNRSYRRFDNSFKLSKEELVDLVDVARLSSCGGNNQLLRYAVFNKDEDLNYIFSNLKWAGLLKDWKGPDENERPTGYIFIYKEAGKGAFSDIDCGIAANNILLAARELGLGGCMFKSFGKVEEGFSFENLELLLVIALGKPVEEVVLVDVENNDTKYYRDEKKTHFVPKRKLADVLLN